MPVRDWRWNGKTLILAARAAASFRRAVKTGLVGARYYEDGRRIGWRMWWKGYTKSRGVLMSPVSNTRYFEFDFAERGLGEAPKEARLLDVSSPFLFSFRLAERRPDLRIRMVNPDERDLALTRAMLAVNPRPGMETATDGIAELAALPEGSFDAVWSISVLEHIGEEFGGDREACRVLWRVLKPGGRMILTLPTDQTCWEEFRPKDPYGLKEEGEDERGVFFQRFYDVAAIRERIIGTVGCEPLVCEWFGVKEKGHFHSYIREWLERGAETVLRDPEDIARNYQRYASFGEMPGEGVCGLVFVKGGMA